MAFKTTSRNIPQRRHGRMCILSVEMPTGWCCGKNLGADEYLFQHQEDNKIPLNNLETSKKKIKVLVYPALTLTFHSGHVRESEDSLPLTLLPTKHEGRWVPYAYKWLLILLQR